MQESNYVKCRVGCKLTGY